MSIVDNSLQSPNRRLRFRAATGANGQVCLLVFSLRLASEYAHECQGPHQGQHPLEAAITKDS